MSARETAIPRMTCPVCGSLMIVTGISEATPAQPASITLVCPDTECRGVQCVVTVL